MRRFLIGKKLLAYRLCSALAGIAGVVVASGAGHKFT
jgi:hypothetical protein